jgi:hypothetical protein
MKRQRAKKFATVLKLVGRERLENFLRGLAAAPEALSGRCLAADLEAGQTLEEIFAEQEQDGVRSGYYTSATRDEDGSFLIEFGYYADCNAGDGGAWRVTFDGDAVAEMALEGGPWIH